MASLSMILTWLFVSFFSDLVSITLSEIQGSCLCMSKAPSALHIRQKIDRLVSGDAFFHPFFPYFPTCCNQDLSDLRQMVLQDASRSPPPTLLAGFWALGPSVCLDLSYPPHLGMTAHPLPFSSNPACPRGIRVIHPRVPLSLCC